ncbi:MAG: GNAT family N-acetyltransferase [Haloarculaceae archaeon]
MAFLEGDAVELVPLDPGTDAHVEAYRRSRVDPRMRATGAYDRGGVTTERAREEVREKGEESTAAPCAIRAEGEVVGWASTALHDERARAAMLAYYVLPGWQGRGYASEAARLLADYAFDELNARRLEAHVLADNPASVRVLEKLGFLEEGRKRDAYYKDGEYRDAVIYGLLAEERAGDAGD